MKIGFTGTHGTGKSTLAEQIAEYCGLPLITGITRKVLSEGHPIKQEGTLLSQICITTAQIEAENKLPSFVTDRTFIDQIAYSTENALPKEYLHLLEELAKLSVCKYDFVFYLPIQSYPLIEDGVRTLDEDYRRTIDQNIQSVLKGLKIEYFSISGGFAQELAQIKEVIGSKRA